LVKLDICKFWLHYGAANIDKFSKGTRQQKKFGNCCFRPFASSFKMTLHIRFNGPCVATWRWRHMQRNSHR